MRRIHTLVAYLLTSALLVSVVIVGHVLPVGAQDSAALGDPVPVTDEEGNPAGSIAVTDVVDPFTDFDPAYPPESGTRFVAVNVAFEADAGERFDIAPRAIVMQDDAGFLWNQGSLFLPDDAVIPELSSQELAPGSRVTGIVGFAMPDGREPARVFYQPESSRLVDLAELLGQEAPRVGDAVSIVDSEGGTGTATVTEVADPFEGFDPAQPPPDGARLVLVTLVYENSGEGRFFLEPFGLVLRDANGDLWTSTSVSRADEAEIVPDLSRTQLAPGDRLSGVVAFAVPEETALAGIYAGPVSGQLIQLADPREGVAVERDPSVATPAAALDEETTTALTEACVDVARWLETAQGRIARVGALDLEDVTLEDLARLAEHLPLYAELAEDQLAEQAPPAVEAVDQALAATFRSHADAVEQIMGAGEPGKDPIQELTEGITTLAEAGERLQEIDAELTRIADDCGVSWENPSG